MVANLDVAIGHARTVALLHPTSIRRAPIGLYYLYEGRHIRLRVSDQAGLDDYGVWAPAYGDDWATVLQWSPYMAESERPQIFLPGAWILYLRAGSVQESGVPGLARGALEPRRITKDCVELKGGGRLYQTLYQPNYSLIEQVVNPADQLRQESLARLQTVLPFSDRPVQPSLPTSLVGAQYEFGLHDIAGERYNQVPVFGTANGRGVFVSGPFSIDGTPEIIRLDADITGQVDCYLICRLAGHADQVVAQLVPGSALSFLDAWDSRGTPTKADLYLKWVFRSDDAVLTRFLLQVTQGA
jgi:hypothetical protein